MMLRLQSFRELLHAIVSKDFSGNRFGRISVLQFSHNDKGNIYWGCKCDCGIVKLIRGSHLKSGSVVSCGCFNAERAANQLRKHGLSKTPTWNIWASMMQRCYRSEER